MPQARSTPGGLHLTDGYTTKVAFALDPDISLWERETTPPPLEGGDPIDLTTFWNTAVRTSGPRALYDVGQFQFVAAYDPSVYDQVAAIINQLGLITIHFPNTDTIDFYGWLRGFAPSSHTDADMPTATATIEVSNRTGGGTETAPSFADGGGT